MYLVFLNKPWKKEKKKTPRLEKKIRAKKKNLKEWRKKFKQNPFERNFPNEDHPDH